MKQESQHQRKLILHSAKITVHQEILKENLKGAQEAHEAIRPTNFALHSVDVDRDQARLYELI